MSWVKCPKCNKITPDYNRACISCGNDLILNPPKAQSAEGIYESARQRDEANANGAMATFAALAVLLFVGFVVIKGCGGTSKKQSTNSGSVMLAEFRTLEACLAGISRSSGASLRPSTDTPSKVAGKLSDGRFFVCEMKVTGTKGTYFEGWYTN